MPDLKAECGELLWMCEKYPIASISVERVLPIARGYLELLAENERLRHSVLNIEGDNQCWIPKAGAFQLPPRAEFLESCSRFHAQLASAHGGLVGCMTIAELEQDNERLRGVMGPATALLERADAGSGPWQEPLLIFGALIFGFVLGAICGLAMFGPPPGDDF